MTAARPAALLRCADLGLVTVGVEGLGYSLRLSHIAEEEWRAKFSAHPMWASAGYGVAATPWKVVQLAAWAAMGPQMAVKGGHWYRIRLIGSALEASLEHARMLKAISDAMAVRTIAAAAKRTAGEIVRVRPARIYTDREAGIVCYLDDGALALYRIAGGLREPEAHLDALPDGDRLTRTLDGRYYAVDQRRGVQTTARAVMPEAPRLSAIDTRKTAVVTQTFTAADAGKAVRFAAASAAFQDGPPLNTVLPKYTAMHPTQVREPFHRPG